LLPGILAAQEPERSGTPRALTPGKETAEDSNAQPIPAISLLPDGSVLEKVMLPRYDSNRKLTSVLRCDEMTLVSSDIITGKNVSIESFNPDRTVKAHLELANAFYDQAESILKANETVTIVSERLTAKGTGLIYSLDQQKGFLKGPVTTTLLEAPSTAMNSASPGLRATALLGASLMPLIAAPPVVPAAESAKITQEAAPVGEKATEAEKAARNDLRAALEASDATNKATREFLEKAGELDANGEGGAAAQPPAEPKPFEIPDDPNGTKIHSKGLYFDAKENAVVFLKDVVVDDPRYELTASNELKIYFEKKAPADPKKEATPKKEGADAKKGSFSFSGSGSFGNPRSMVATGAVVLTQKNPDKGEAPLKASGSLFHYEIASGAATIRGGSPWIVRGNQGLRAGKANSWIRIDKEYNFVTDPDGKWTAFGAVNKPK